MTEKKASLHEKLVIAVVACIMIAIYIKILFF